MKKIITILLTTVMTLSISLTAFAVEIPIESLPHNATHEGMIITENLIGEILTEVKNGMGYQDAWAKANKKIFTAVLNRETNGNGYADLAAIARNSIWHYRDMYLRPEFHIQTEAYIKNLIAEVITEVENGLDYNEGLKKAYIIIYKSKNPHFNAEETFSVDSCYRDIPAVDSVLFTYARKHLHEAVSRREQK